MGIFTLINEYSANSFQTKEIKPGDFNRVASVSLAIKTHFLDQPSWDIKKEKGSWTLSSKRHPHQVVKVFVDYDRKLAELCNITDQFDYDPVIVGFEITEQPAFAREAIRNEIAKKFKCYIDPRVAGNSKWWLKPVNDHKHDIVFLFNGECEYQVDMRELEALLQEFPNSSNE